MENLYRIKVEWIPDREPTEDERLEEGWSEGVECTGFCITGKFISKEGKEGSHTSIQHMTTTDIGHVMAHNDNLLTASAIAIGIHDAVAKYKKPSLDFLKGLLND